jgi:hypothetical protein
VIEYIIRTAGEHAWPAVHRDRLAAVLTPAGSDWSATDGWGDYRLRRGDTEISFAGDMVGWLVSFDGPISDAEAHRLIEVIASQIETEVGESIDFVQVGWQE